MKKSLAFSAVLITIDQAAKLLVSRCCMHADAVLLPGVLIFRPVQNTHLTWVASMFDYKAPVCLMLVVQTLGIAVTLLAYRYLLYLWDESKHILNGMLAFFIAGILCSFIDVTLWGGSLDFLRLFDWFTFDLKDVCLTIGIIHVFLYGCVYYSKKYRGLSQEERRQTGILIWIKRGLPSSPAK